MRNSQVEQITDPKVALQALKDGNKRFVAGQPSVKNDTADRVETVGTQKPFAAILTCADSRTSPEIFFDARVGDLFVLRNAGNFATDEELGALEFGTAVLGASVIVVIGHQNCGAVFATFDKPAGLPEKLQGIVDNIAPGIAGAPDKDAAIKANTLAVVEAVKANPVVKEKGVPVVGAYYHFETGVVTFYE